MNDNTVRAICIPAVAALASSTIRLGPVTDSPISVLGRVLARTISEDVDIGEYNVAGIGNKRVPLWAVSEVQIRNFGILRTDETEKNGS